MKKILYIMGIDWAWIYQRPQIIAEKLASDFDVTVIFPRSILSRNRKIPKVPGLKMRILWTLPYQEKNPVLEKVAIACQKRLFKDIDQYDVIYIGYPIYERYIPTNYRGKILFDCMDNFAALYPDRKRAYRMEEREQALLARCDEVLFSSKGLSHKVQEESGRNLGILVRNATKTTNVEAIREPWKKDCYDLCYIGTIAEWFDFELLQESLQIMPVKYHLLGPAVRQVSGEGLFYHGPVPHELLTRKIACYDCLIMPFVMNEIVKYVDPVKLYEYIAFGKCIVSVYYEEVEQFGDFVYFYHNKEEYFQLLKELSSRGFPAKYTEEQRTEFLRKNTWDARYEIIKACILGF